MSKKLSVALLVSLSVLLLLFQAVAAQSTPRPTPTNTGSSVQADSGERGSIQGVVYLDLNGDGVCVNSGVEGEKPIEGIPVEFVSSDEQTVLRLNSGPDGIYGLFAAGQSNWAVSAKPDSRYVVTSEQTIYVPVYPDQSLNATDINFCVQEVSLANVILPESGQANVGGWITAVFLLIGLIFVGAGLVIQRRRLQNQF